MTDAPRSILAWLGGPHQGLSFAGGPSGKEIEYIRADVARAEAELAVAEAIRRAGKLADNWQNDTGVDIAAAARICPQIAVAILALADTDGLALVQALRSERDDLERR